MNINKIGLETLTRYRNRQRTIFSIQSLGRDAARSVFGRSSRTDDDDAPVDSDALFDSSTRHFFDLSIFRAAASKGFSSKARSSWPLIDDVSGQDDRINARNAGPICECKSPTMDIVIFRTFGLVLSHSWTEDDEIGIRRG
jgi:hypothetical protein